MKFHYPGNSNIPRCEKGIDAAPHISARERMSCKCFAYVQGGNYLRYGNVNGLTPMDTFPLLNN